MSKVDAYKRELDQVKMRLECTEQNFKRLKEHLDFLKEEIELKVEFGIEWENPELGISEFIYHVRKFKDGTFRTRKLPSSGSTWKWTDAILDMELAALILELAEHLDE